MVRQDRPEQSETTPAGPSARRLRLSASILGIVGVLLALSIPFLPVKHDATTLKWPTQQGTKSVSAPLVAFSPLQLDASVPCSAAQSLDARTDGPGVLLSTNAPSSDYGKLTGLTMQVDNGRVALLSQGQQLSTAPLPESGCSISLHSDASGTNASIGGQSMIRTHEDQRPQLTGIYSQLDSQRDDTQGLSFQAQVDNRFDTSATALKIAAIVLTVLAFVGCVICLRKLDTRAGRRPPRLAPSGWWKPTPRDVAVLLAFGFWWLIGAMTSDDGYILTMMRTREASGYVSNYFRWFANPESPWGWYQDLCAFWVQVSTLIPWVRIPALLLGIGSWLLISREVLPRLGQQVRRSRAAGWAAAAVFLAFWLPYNNGLRPEPVVVFFSLLGLCAVERAVATRRLMPAAVGLFGSALAVGANPHGLVAVLPFVVAYKPLFRLVRQRAKQFGWLPVLAPIATSGLVMMTVVFADQTLQSVLESITLKTEFGPSGHWYEELSRYNLLFSPIPDGSLTRRFPVLLAILCLVTCAVVLLRRGSIRGAALGPSRRLLAITALSFVVLALTKTKHTHHFGIFAAVGGALAALTALATSTTVLRSKRNRAGFFAGLMVICAFAATGPNAWWYASGWGAPWYDKPPSFHGYQVSTLLLVVAAISGVVAAIEHLRLDEHNPQVLDRVNTEQRSRALRLGTAPLSIICALLILSELATFGKSISKQWDSYSPGVDNVKQLAGASCGMSDYVQVETEPKAGVLHPSARQPAQVSPSTPPELAKPPKELRSEETPAEYLRDKQEGFQRPGLPPGTGTAPDEPDWKPPFQFGGDDAPVWGSYEPKGTGTGELRSPWYDVPPDAADGKSPIVLSLAGIESGANSLALEFGRDTDRGFEVLDRQPVQQEPAPQWRDHRTVVGDEARGATKVRVVGDDQALGLQGWLAVSPPRVPQLTTMTQVVGDDPTFVEWPAALMHPCLNISQLRDGIAEMPKFRVAGGGDVRDIGQGWSSPDAGGPFGWMNVASSVQELPTYMQNDPQMDWGSLYEVDPYGADALPSRAATHVRSETHSGLWSPGPLTHSVQLPGDVPSTDDRTDTPSRRGDTSQQQ